MSLTLSELEKCFEILVKMMKDRGLSEVASKNKDLYWSVLSEDWLSFQAEPVPAVGSLDDDLSGLKNLLIRDTAPSVVDVERMSAILKLIAHDLSCEGREGTTL